MQNKPNTLTVGYTVVAGGHEERVERQITVSEEVRKRIVAEFHYERERPVMERLLKEIERESGRRYKAGSWDMLIERGCGE